MLFRKLWCNLIAVVSISAIVMPILSGSAVAVVPNKKSGFEPPPRRDAPNGGTAGGGSRPATIACGNSSSKSTLAALTPGRHVGLSQAQNPTFYVHLPRTTAQIAEFSLFDANLKGVYQVNIPVNQTGLVKISLPKDAPSLQKNQPYYWSFAVACNPNDRTNDWVVGGWVEHAQPNHILQQQLTKVSGVERISLYAKQGFWYDAIATAMELQHQQTVTPQISQAWTELLESVGLNVIATAKLESPENMLGKLSSQQSTPSGSAALTKE